MSRTPSAFERVVVVSGANPALALGARISRPAGRIKGYAPLAVRFAKLAINSAPHLDAAGRDTVKMLAQAILFDSDEKMERMTRFLERKKK